MKPGSQVLLAAVTSVITQCLAVALLPHLWLGSTWMAVAFAGVLGAAGVLVLRVAASATGPPLLIGFGVGTVLVWVATLVRRDRAEVGVVGATAEGALIAFAVVAIGATLSVLITVQTSRLTAHRTRHGE